MTTNGENGFNDNCVNDNQIKKSLLAKGPKIVAIGGGTGLSTMLRGLKAYSSNITAVVTVADDGGGSGLLRQDLGMLPPGDIRNCILALANTEPIMEQLLQYRFSEGILKGQSFGNLFLAAMNGISGSFEQAVRRVSDVLAVTGRVLPVTLDDRVLCAEIEDGYIIRGQSKISRHNSAHFGKIRRVFFEPEGAMALKEVLDVIGDADAVVLGPGSLYTSVLPNLMVEGISEAINKSGAVKIYICNIMTQPGETDGYSASDHIRAIEENTYGCKLDYCVANNGRAPESLIDKYLEDGAGLVEIDADNIKARGKILIEGSFASTAKDLMRHDPIKLAKAVMGILNF